MLKSSTIDKLGEWCLERRVRPRIKPSRMRRVSMTTLWAATLKVFGERRARAQGGRGAKTPNLPSSNPQANPTNKPKDRRTTPSAPLFPPKWTLMASKYDAAQPDKPNPCTHLPGMSRAATGHAKEEDYDKKHSRGACPHALWPEVKTKEADLDMNWARPEKKEEEIPIDLSHAVNKQLTSKAA